MVTRNGNTYVYANFRSGLGVPDQQPPEGKVFTMAFMEGDFENEDLNPTHIFNVPADEIDKMIGALQDIKRQLLVGGIALPDNDSVRRFGRKAT